MRERAAIPQKDPIRVDEFRRWGVDVLSLINFKNNNLINYFDCILIFSISLKFLMAL
jgi:hypothetical protein